MVFLLSESMLPVLLIMVLVSRSKHTSTCVTFDRFADMHQLFDGMQMSEYHMEKLLLLCKINATL
jgi:hypothetical protein